MKVDQLTLGLWIGILVIFVTVCFSLILIFLFAGGLSSVFSSLVPISGFIALMSIAVSSWIAVNNYRLKIETEKRLNDASLVKSNVRILTLFSKMMQMANSRYDPIMSEKVIENLFQYKMITPDDYQAGNLPLARIKLETAVITPPYGEATQVAAIGAIYALGKENPILLDALLEDWLQLNLITPNPW